MGVIPTVPTFSAGAVLTAAQVNQVKAAVDFLQNPPGCSAYNTTAPSLVTSTWTVVPLDAELYDNVQAGDTGMHDNVTTNSRIFFRTAGKYMVSGQVSFTTNATGARQADLRLNSAGVVNGGSRISFSSQAAVSGIATAVSLPVATFTAAVGDHIELWGWQSSGAGLTLLGGAGLTFMNVRLVTA